MGPKFITSELCSSLYKLHSFFLMQTGGVKFITVQLHVYSAEVFCTEKKLVQIVQVFFCVQKACTADRLHIFFCVCSYNLFSGQEKTTGKKCFGLSVWTFTDFEFYLFGLQPQFVG